MSALIRFFIKQPLFADLLTLFILLVGAASALLIRREAFPNVVFDIITVNSIYAGASPEEVEKLVTNPIEQDMKEVDGIKRLTSTSVEGRSYIWAQLDPDQTDEKKGKEDIQDVVDGLTSDLPKEVERPLVKSIEAKLTPIIQIAMGGDVPEIELRAKAKELEKDLEKLPGVARVEPQALPDLEIRVAADPKRLQAYRLSLNDLIDALKQQNVNVPGGTVKPTAAGAAGHEIMVRVIGEYKSLRSIEDTVIRANDIGTPVRVGNVAKVYYDLEEKQVDSRANGKPAVILTVLKKEKADAIHVVDAVRKRVKEYEAAQGGALRMSYIEDFSEFIRRRLSVLTSNLLVGLVLVFLVLAAMLPVSVAVLVAMGIPFAFFATMIFFNYMGFSVNLISLLGLIIVSGMLVDDAIVVTDNAVRHMEDGKPPEEAVTLGTLQVWAPIAASVLTTVVAFLPMMFMSGIFGKFVREIPVGVIVALLFSLFEAYFILPAHIMRWVRIPPREPASAARGEGVSRFSAIKARVRGFWPDVVVPFYGRLLAWTLKHRYIMAGLFAGLFFGTLLLGAKGMRFILFPPEGVETFFVRAEAPVGTSIERMGELVKPLEAIVAKLPPHELDNYITTLGIHQQEPNDPFAKRGSHYAQIAVNLTAEERRERMAAEIIDGLRPQLGLPPGLDKVYFTRVNPGPPVGKAVDIGIQGGRYEDIMPAVAEMKKFLGAIPGVIDIDDSHVTGKEEIRLSVKPAEAAAAGLSVAEIGTTVRAAFEGIEATSIRELDDEVKIRVSLNEGSRTRASTLESIEIPNRQGYLVPLTRVASTARDRGIAVYGHEDNQRQVRVSADVDVTKVSATEVAEKVQAYAPEFKKLFPKVDINMGGEDEDTKESMQSLLRAFAVAALGIFLILVLTFKNLSQTLLVMITLPMGIISVILAFFFHGMPLSFMGILGIVALAGVIVNNAIVFIDFVNQKRADGVGRLQSILESAKMRLRPIFLTSITTVFGVLPTAYGIGGMDRFVVPIAMALGWGLLFGAVLTAVFFPVAVAIVDDLQAVFGRVIQKILKKKPA